VRHPKIGSVDLHPLRIPQEAGDKAGRQVEYLILKCSTMECDLPVHRGSIANVLYVCKGNKLVSWPCNRT
jgi:hypothetical protein